MAHAVGTFLPVVYLPRPRSFQSQEVERVEGVYSYYLQPHWVSIIGKHVVGQRGLWCCAEDGRPRLDSSPAGLGCAHQG